MPSPRSAHPSGKAGNAEGPHSKRAHFASALEPVRRGEMLETILSGRLNYLAYRTLRLALLFLGTLAFIFVLVYILTLTVPETNKLIARRFIFFPEKQLVGNPSHWGLSFEEVVFPASDGVKLHGWYVQGNSDVTWIWFHGNAGNISHRLEDLMLLNSHLGVNILLFDYRGYGRSEGKVSEKGTYRDARGALDYLLSRDDVNPRKIVYFGRSLGAAVAVELATQHQPHGLILESAFSSVKDMAKAKYPFLPLFLLVRTKYDSISKIGTVSSPILIVHGEKDEIVPMSQGRRLYDAAKSPKTFYEVSGATHNETSARGGEPYFAALAEFLQSLAR